MLNFGDQKISELIEEPPSLMLGKLFLHFYIFTLTNLIAIWPNVEFFYPTVVVAIVVGLTNRKFEMRNGLIWRLILISTAFGRYKIDGLRPLFNVYGLRPLYFEVDGLRPWGKSQPLPYTLKVNVAV